jgi:hypothetical protein
VKKGWWGAASGGYFHHEACIVMWLVCVGINWGKMIKRRVSFPCWCYWTTYGSFYIVVPIVYSLWNKN